MDFRQGVVKFLLILMVLSYLGCTKSIAEKFFEADNAKIQYSGRIDFSNPKKPKFSAPGVSIKTKFKGNTCNVLFKDQCLFRKGDRNFYALILDKSKVIVVAPVHPGRPDSSYTDAASGIKILATDTSCRVLGLTDALHSITFTKRTESSIGFCIFIGFQAKELVAPEPKPTRKIEFIGNSISCGFGVDAAINSRECTLNSWFMPNGWAQPFHNSYLAFGPVLARKLNADFHLTAASGIGLTRNYTTIYDTRPMPQVYKQMFLEENPGEVMWDVKKFVPDAIVIELGTNDFSPGDNNRDPYVDTSVYVSKYIEFINTLKSYYPNTHIFCLTSPMLTDGWPNAKDKSATNHNNSIDAIERHYQKMGDKKVHKIKVNKVPGLGCTTHPDANEQEKIAAEIEPVIRKTLNW